VATILLMVALLFLGAIAYPLLPVAPLPQIDFPTISVSTQLPGASPETMASSVTQPPERTFGQIPGVTQMTSISVLGASTITVQFDLSRDGQRWTSSRPSTRRPASCRPTCRLRPSTAR
jgi:hydrophobic/amphiphilic exporter-1 (mainly G- bacteria), HAE1 family